MNDTQCANKDGCDRPGVHPVADRLLCDLCESWIRRKAAERILEFQIERAITHHRQVDACVADVRAMYGEDAALQMLRHASVSTARAGQGQGT